MPNLKEVLMILGIAVALLWVGVNQGCAPQKPNQPPHVCVCTFKDGSMRSYMVMDVEGLNDIVFSINNQKDLVPVVSCNCPSIGHE